MWYSNFIITVSFLVISLSNYGNSARILGIFPTASVSHQVVFRGLTLALNKRGHELVVVTTDPVKDQNLKNYTEIDINFLYDIPFEENFITKRPKFNLLSMIFEILVMFDRQTEQIFMQPEFKKLYKLDSNEKFDLILVEVFFSPAFLSLAKRFDAPIVGIASTSLPINIQYAIGTPILSSHPSNWEIHTMHFASSTFWDRLKNFYTVWKYIYYYQTIHVKNQEAIAKNYIGIESIDLSEIARNISVVFVNQQRAISDAKPNIPNVIEIGGIHVGKQIKSLPKDLQKFLDEATEGFIYMSLGSNVKSSMLSVERRNEFIAAFSKLPYKVIWKFEDDIFPNKPDNVIIMKWTPQQGILAHPNLKAFIYQGGLQSTEEAISHAVPLIGLPVIGDQDLQVDKMVSLGVAKRLEISSLNRDDLLEAIRVVTLDPSFKEKMLNLRSIINDKPHDSLENAIWWTEFVIRHKGASHLHSSTADEPWYQRDDMDIIAFISAGSVTALILVLVILYQFLVCSKAAFRNWSANEKQKKN